jgi:hypothetical protein
MSDQPSERTEESYIARRLWSRPRVDESVAFPMKWNDANCEVLWGMMQDLLDEARARRSMEPTLTAAVIGFSAAATFGVYNVEEHPYAVMALLALSILLGVAVFLKIEAEHRRYQDCRYELHAMARGLAAFLKVTVSDLPYVYRKPVAGKGHHGSLLIVGICILLQLGVAAAYIFFDAQPDSSPSVTP